MLLYPKAKYFIQFRGGGGLCSAVLDLPCSIYPSLSQAISSCLLIAESPVRARSDAATGCKEQWTHSARGIPDGGWDSSSENLGPNVIPNLRWLQSHKWHNLWGGGVELLNTHSGVSFPGFPCQAPLFTSCASWASHLPSLSPFSYWPKKWGK